MKRVPLIAALLLAPAGAASAAEAAPGPSAWTAVTPGGKEYAPIWTPQITAVDGVREGKWCGALWCPISGTAVRLIGNTSPACGMADVYIDGIFRKRIDGYSEQEARDAVLFSAEGLPDGRHLLGLLTRETKRPESAGTALLWLDAWDLSWFDRPR